MSCSVVVRQTATCNQQGWDSQLLAGPTYRVAFAVAQAERFVADSQRLSHTAQPQSSLIHRQGRRLPIASLHRPYHHLHSHTFDEETILFFLPTLTRRQHRDHDLHNRHPHQAPQRVHRKSPREPPRRPALCLQDLSQLTRHALGSPSHR